MDFSQLYTRSNILGENEELETNILTAPKREGSWASEQIWCWTERLWTLWGSGVGRYVDSDSNNVSLCCWWPTTVNCNALSPTFGVRVKIRLHCTPSIFRAGQRRQIKRLVDRVGETFERWVRFVIHTLSVLRKYLWWIFIPVDYEIVQQFYRII